MSKTDAEYMRAYRARKKALGTETIMGYDATKAEQYIVELEEGISMAKGLVTQADALARAERAKREELEAEVKHLKAELAKRGVGVVKTTIPIGERFNSRPFTPAPKGK